MRRKDGKRRRRDPLVRVGPDRVRLIVLISAVLFVRESLVAWRWICATNEVGRMPTVVPVVCPGHSRPVVEVSFGYASIAGVGYDDNAGDDDLGRRGDTEKTNAERRLLLVTACLDRQPMLRDGVTGDWIGTFVGHNGAVWSAKLDKRGAELCATGSADFTAKLWDAVSGNEKHSWGHRHIVKTVDFSPSSESLFTGSRDKFARVFDLQALNSTDASKIVHPGTVNKVISIGDKQCITGCEDGVLRLWDPRASDFARTVDLGSPISDMELSADGKILAVASGRSVNFVSISGANSFTVTKQYTMSRVIEAVSLSEDQKTFITGGTNLWVYMYDYLTGKELATRKGHHGPVHCVRFCPGGKNFCSGADDATLRLWIHEEDGDGSDGK